MFNLFPMQGLGSNGLGAAGGMGLSGIPPQLAALLGSGGGGGMPGAPGGGMPGMPGAGMAGGPGSPLSAYIGAQHPMMGGGGAMMPPIPAGAGQPPQQQQGIASMLGNPQGLQQLLAALKGGQTGLPMTQSGAPTGGMPNQTPGVGANQVVPGMGGAGGNPMMNLPMLLRQLGMFGGMTGGAPT